MSRTLKQVREWLWFFVIILFLSGLTAVPAQTELEFLHRVYSGDNKWEDWLSKVLDGVATTEKNFPLLFYGYDWLAFAHFALAILFSGAIRNPFRNIWVIELAMICCQLVIPFALIAGHFRGIPMG